MNSIVDIVSGRYWWCLERGLSSARISRVVRRKGHAVVLDSFEGALSGCRTFQVEKGGASDGVILIDDTVPVRFYIGEEGEAVRGAEGEFAVVPGFRASDFRFVSSQDGAFSVAVSSRAADASVEEVASAGFAVLAEVPAVMFTTDLLPVPPEDTSVFVCATSHHLDFWLFSNSSLQTYHRVAAGDPSRVSEFFEFLRKRFALPVKLDVFFYAGSGTPQAVLDLLTSLEAKPFELRDVALAAAEDAWIFRTSSLPSVLEAPSITALSRLREAALFRRVIKWACVFIALSFAVIGLLNVSYAFYAWHFRDDLRTVERSALASKELDSLRLKLEADRHEAEVLLKHRSRVALGMTGLVEKLPQGVWLTDWNVDGRIHSVRGYALSDSDVSSMLSLLEKSGKFSGVRLRTTERTSWRFRPVVRFDFVAEELQ